MRGHHCPMASLHGAAYGDGAGPDEHGDRPSNGLSLGRLRLRWDACVEPARTTPTLPLYNRLMAPCYCPVWHQLQAHGGHHPTYSGRSESRNTRSKALSAARPSTRPASSCTSVMYEASPEHAKFCVANLTLYSAASMVVTAPRPRAQHPQATEWSSRSRCRSRVPGVRRSLAPGQPRTRRCHT